MNNGNVKLQYRYIAHNTFDASEKIKPFILAWTTLPKKDKNHAPIHRHALQYDMHNTNEYAIVEVNFPYKKTESWRQDTAIHFILMTAKKDRTYRKTASTEIYFADLLSNKKNEFIKVPMRVQAYYMPDMEHNKPKQIIAERHKGDIIIQIISLSKPPIWQKKNKYDMTPAHIHDMQKLLTMTISLNMSIFAKHISGKGMEPTLPELDRIHAPMYVQETNLAADGATFVRSAVKIAKDHVKFSGGPLKIMLYLRVLVIQSLERHNMSQAEFLRISLFFSSKTKSLASDTELINRVTAILGTVCAMRVTMMKYTPDTVVLAESKRTVMVESFDQVDDRVYKVKDEGGVQSRDINSKPRHAYPLEEEEKKKRKQGIDCEDTLEDGGTVFIFFRDPEAGLPDMSAYPLLQGLRDIAMHYRGLGVLCSVLSSNLNDATKNNTQFDDDVPDIGSAADLNVKVGAHMFLILVPSTVLFIFVGRALATSIGIHESLHAGLDLGESPNDLLITPLANKHKHLPTVAVEGTGLMDNLMLPSPVYVDGYINKIQVAVKTLQVEEAHYRMSTNMNSSTSGTAIISPSLSQFTPMHVQNRIVDNPKKRLVQFYREAAELYLIPLNSQLEDRRHRKKSRSAYQLVGDRLIPKKIYPRESGKQSTWGVSVSHIIRQDIDVGLLPTPEPSLNETHIVDRIEHHMLPGLPLELDTKPSTNPYIVKAETYPSLLRQESGLPSVKSAINKIKRQIILADGAGGHESVLIHTYAHPSDLNSTIIKELAIWLKKNQYVIAASLVIEHSSFELAMVRLDTIIDVGNLSKLVLPKLKQTFKTKKTLSQKNNIKKKNRSNHNNNKMFVAASNFGKSCLQQQQGKEHCKIMTTTMTPTQPFVYLYKTYDYLTKLYCKASLLHHKKSRLKEEADVIDLDNESEIVILWINQNTEWFNTFNCAIAQYDNQTLIKYKNFLKYNYLNHDGDLDNYHSSSIPKYWSDFFFIHTKLLKNIIDASWDPLRNHLKNKYIKKMLSNQKQYLKFLNIIFTQQRQDIASDWKTYTKQILIYIQNQVVNLNSKSNKHHPDLDLDLDDSAAAASITLKLSIKIGKKMDSFFSL